MPGPKDGNAAVVELRKCPAGLDPVLADTLPAGVAYHHAGLTVHDLQPMLTIPFFGVQHAMEGLSNFDRTGRILPRHEAYALRKT